MIRAPKMICTRNVIRKTLTDRWLRTHPKKPFFFLLSVFFPLEKHLSLSNPIPPSAYGLDIVTAKFVAQVLDMRIHDPLIDKGIEVPQHIQQHLSGIDPSRVFRHRQKKIKFTGSNIHLLPFDQHLHAVRNQGKVAAGNGSTSAFRVGRYILTAEDRAHFPKKDRHGKRLRHVVVGHRVVALDQVLLIAQRRQHQDRNIRLLLDDLAHPVPVDLRDHDVEDHQVRVLRKACDRLDAIFGRHDIIALVTKVIHEELTNIRFIFHNKNLSHALIIKQFYGFNVEIHDIIILVTAGRSEVMTMAFNVSFSNTIPFNDPKYRSIFIKISGDLLVESDDPNYLVPGSETTVKYVADMANYSIGRTLINMGTVSYKELSTKLGEFVNVIASDLKSRQITLVGASFEPITPDEASRIRIKRLDEMEKLASDPAAMAAKMQEAQAQAAASVAAAQAAPIAAQASAPAAAPVQAAPASNEPQLMKYCARCGTLASGSKFCTNCGSSLIKRS